MTLLDDDFANLDFDCLGSQVGGKAVFFSTQKDNADDSGKMVATKRDIRYGEHQCIIRKTALRPCIFAWKGITPVTFDISDGIMEHKGRAVDEKRTVYRVPHTVNAVPALHEGNISEWPHDVIFDRREKTKPDRAICTEFRRLDIQRDAFLPKPISSNTDLIIPFLKNRVGEWQMEGLRIAYQLYGAEFGLFGSVDGWNDGECLPFRLAAKIPATEIVAHRGASQDNLEDIIPILIRIETKRGGNHEHSEKH